MNRAIEELHTTSGSGRRVRADRIAGPGRIVTAISFDHRGVTVEYLTPEVDLKANRVRLTHRVFIPMGDQYDDEIDAVIGAALYLLEDVLEDVPDMKGYPAQVEDEMKGMGE